MTNSSLMKVCYFGTYSVEDGYPRNRILIKGLKKSGVIIKECHVNLWKSSSDKVGRLFGICGIMLNVLRLIRAQIILFAKFMFIGSYDVIIVGSTGHIEILLAKALNIVSNKPVIFDAFISLYDTLVNDRKIFSKESVIATILRWLDRTACRLADIVILDTNAHIEYFCREFKLPRKKFRRVFIGADDDVFFPKESSYVDKFNVLFFGSFIPLHGIEYIIEAAKILENNKDIHFVIIGKGQEAERIRRIVFEQKIKNVELIDKFISEGELANYIAKSNLCLGIFGKTQKADMVIPCKVYNCIAMKKPVITARTTAISELLDEGIDVWLCEPCNPNDIAKAILLLKNDSGLAKSLAESGYKKYSNCSSIKHIGIQIKNILEEIVIKKMQD